MLTTASKEDKVDYDSLVQYIEGWLQYKENKKYDRFWFVLRGGLMNDRELITAHLFCFKDLNIHVEDHQLGQIQIQIPHDKIEFVKLAGNKRMKCDFSITLCDTKFNFRADDEISRERWLYAFCDLVAKAKLPSELPTERNAIRTTCGQKKTEKKPGAFQRSKTVVEITQRTSIGGSTYQWPMAQSSRAATISNHAGLRSAKGSHSFDVASSSPPISPPPRSVHSLPFMLPPNAQLHDISWYYPGMKRDEAQEKLSRCPPGYYLLRDSESKLGSYTLTFKDHNKLKHHMISQSSDRLFRFDNSEVETPFPSPQKAVEFYMIKKHSKTVTPTPYYETSLNDFEDDSGYILQEEVNMNTRPKSPAICSRGYMHRDLPPTPAAGIDQNLARIRFISLDDDDDDDGEPYLEVSNDARVPSISSTIANGYAKTKTSRSKSKSKSSQTSPIKTPTTPVFHDELPEDSEGYLMTDKGDFPKLSTKKSHNVLTKHAGYDEDSEGYMLDFPKLRNSQVSIEDHNGHLKITDKSCSDMSDNDNELNGDHSLKFAGKSNPKTKTNIFTPINDDGDNYLKMSGELSPSDDEHEYLEYEKGEDVSNEQDSKTGEEDSKYINVCFDRTDDSKSHPEPSPAKPELPVKSGINFRPYDSVNIENYQNQEVIKHTPDSPDVPPAIPARNTKPHLPPRNSTRR